MPDLSEVLMMGDLPIIYSGRSLKITVSKICKKLGLSDKDGFRFAVLRDGTVILKPIKNYEDYQKNLISKKKKIEEGDFFF